jgi:hypothetical protein
VRIGETPIDRAYQAIRTIIPRDRDNEMWCRNLGARLLGVPEFLDGLGLIKDMENAPFVVEKGGREVSSVLHPEPIEPEQLRHNWPPLPAGWVDASDTTAPPLWLKDPTNLYWFEYLKETRVVYVQFNAVQNKKDEPVAAFFERVSRFVDANPVDKRSTCASTAAAASTSTSRCRWILRVDKEPAGKLFTVIGRQTFSAARTSST